MPVFLSCRFRRSLCSLLLAILVASCAHQAPATPPPTVTIPGSAAAEPTGLKNVLFEPFPGMRFQGRVGHLDVEGSMGRMLWNLWTGDSASYWNTQAKRGGAAPDLLKLVASPRRERFETYGVINQPGYVPSTEADEHGLFLDRPKSVWYDIDLRLEQNLDPAIYGRSSGVMGLRLFPNPAFDAAKWDTQRYWQDPAYYQQADLERPYLVGMACSFCHTGPDPLLPPEDPAEPLYANLNDTAGQSYLKAWKIFRPESSDAPAPAPGTLDLSWIVPDSPSTRVALPAVDHFEGQEATAALKGTTCAAAALYDAPERGPAPLWRWSQQEAQAVAAYLRHDEGPPAR